MNISYNWLRELTDISLAPRDLARRLTMIGLAVDAVHDVDDDFVLEFDLTSNRPDCLSHFGIAREIAALEGGRLNVPRLETASTQGRAELYTAVEILDPDLCARYAARVVRGVKIAPSPSWLARRLEAIGQRPINNVADITNYVLHELGQPLHAFDLAKLSERRIIVRRARHDETLRTLDGVERKLDAGMVVIADASRAVALGGVMGGEETEISATTSEVLIESAYFDPASIRRTSKLLGLQTEASYRFERGTDYEGVRRAQDRCVAMICDIAGGTATEDALDVYARRIERREASLRPRRVEALTGLTVPRTECVRILGALGFEMNGDRPATATNDPSAGSIDVVGKTDATSVSDDTRVDVGVPTWRVDVAIEEDLVEEVARHFGYEKIVDTLPSSGASGEYLEGEDRRRAAARMLAALGFDETINFSFIEAASDGQFDLLPGFPSAMDPPKESLVSLVNPIVDTWTRMRPTLLPGLLGAARHNFNHGKRDLALFEMGRVFAAGRDVEESRPLEEGSFALLMTGGVTEEGRALPSREVDFYDLKGALEAASDAMKLPPLEFRAATIRHLRDGQSARVFLESNAIGAIGRLSDDIASSYKFRQPVYVGEVSLGTMLRTPELPARYTPLSLFPSVIRDVSFIVDRAVSFEELRSAVLGLKIDECRSVTLFDVYEGANVPGRNRSITLRIEYRSDERTLRDDEVDAMHARVVQTLEKEFGAELRR